MALLTVQQVVVPSTTPAYVAVSASDTINNADDRTFLIVRNASGTVDNVAVVIPGNDEFGQAKPDIPVAVPITTGERWIPITTRMADLSTGLVTVTHSQTASVTCALVRV